MKTQIILKATFSLASILLAMSGKCQNTFPASGNVGIGTTSPLTKLQIGAKVADDNAFSYNSNALVVVNPTPTGTTTLNDPQNVLLLARQGTYSQAFGAAATFNLSRYENNVVNSRTRLDISLAHTAFDAMNNPVITFLSSGNVGIGTTKPIEKLSVKGTILAQKVRVSTQTADWPDYVFGANYPLRSLRSLNNYIIKYNHLPDVPAAGEVDKGGLDLGATQAILLKKIEELTLYVIEQDKKNQRLRDRIKHLENRQKIK